MTLEKQQQIEVALQEIWETTAYSKFCEKKFMFPLIEQNKDLLFIGINPSYDERHKDSTYYPVDKTLLTIPYFIAMNNFAKAITNSEETTELNWTHIDLLFFRETEQNKIHDILKTETGRQFVYNQLMVADKLIRYAKPKVIMVCNALARVFMGKEKDKEKNTGIWMDYEFIFDDKIGTHRWEGNPVFFSSMLSGQRALDKGSLERLEWQVKKALIAIK
jgi:hypothetical protein